MTVPRDGNYYIINRESTLYGTQLAVTYSGRSDNSALIVEEKSTDPSQVWVLKDAGNGMTTINPLNAQGSLVGWERNRNIRVGDLKGSIWSLKRTTNGMYIIQDSEHATYWSLKGAEVGQIIYSHTASAPAEILQNWKLIPA